MTDEENTPPPNVAEEETPRPQTEQDLSWGDRMLVPGRPLSPRHRKLAELAAQGKSNQEIARELSYTDSRVSILLTNTQIRNEIIRIKDRIYEDTKKRLKDLTEPALDEIERCITDQTNKYKENLKVETSRWLIEMNEGKATQKHDIGENLLGVMLDKLDNLKSAGGTLKDVTPEPILLEAGNDAEPILVEKTEEDLLKDWVTDFAAHTKK